MDAAVEWFLALTSAVAGASHLLRPVAWAETYARLHRAGRGGAFANGAISLLPGSMVVAGHHAWTWPGGVLTAFGWLMIVKGAVCFFAPDHALRSMEHGARTPRSFIAAGVILLAVSAWAGWCIWLRAG